VTCRVWRWPPERACRVCGEPLGDPATHQCAPEPFEYEPVDLDPWDYGEERRLFEGLVALYEEDAA